MLKDKVYKAAIKPVMAYEEECRAVIKEERKLHTTEMCISQWPRGKTKLDHARNVDFWKEAHMHPILEYLREEVWILQMAIYGNRNRDRPKPRR